MCKILCIIFVVILKRIFYVWVSTGTLQENRPVDTAGEGEGGANWEGSIEAYTLPAVKQTDSGSLLYDAESSNSVLCDNLEGWDGVGSGREVQEGGNIYILMTDSCQYMAETNTVL